MTMKIYTKTGDTGETSLVGGARVRKCAPRVEAYGTVDELNAAVGAALPFVADKNARAALTFLMHKLFNCSSNTATPPDARSERCPQIRSEDILFLESAIDWMQDAAGPINGFVLPTGSKAAGLLHTARTVCRRAERRITALAESSPVDPDVSAFINRASDFLFAAARYCAAVDGVAPPAWDRDAQPPRFGDSDIR